MDGISYDAWNNERAAYTSAYTQSASTFGGPSVSGYGLQDLNYYGGFFYMPGYGYAWQPYGVAGMAGWNPYMAGAWMFNQGLGYSFVSAYPWGWLPYHYGSWAYAPNVGWAWLPGNGSNYRGNGIVTSFQPTPVISRAPAGFTVVQPPSVVTTRPQTILVGQHITGGMAYIPGGRVPPNFRSVLPPTLLQRPSNARAEPGSTFPNNKGAAHNTGETFAHNEIMHPPSGHVFAEPVSRTAPMAEPGMWGSGAGSMRGQGLGGVPTHLDTAGTSRPGHASATTPAAH